MARWWLSYLDGKRRERWLRYLRELISRSAAVLDILTGERRLTTRITIKCLRSRLMRTHPRQPWMQEPSSMAWALLRREPRSMQQERST